MDIVNGCGFQFYKVVYKNEYSGLYTSIDFELLEQAKEFAKSIALCNPKIKTCYY